MERAVKTKSSKQERINMHQPNNKQCLVEQSLGTVHEIHKLGVIDIPARRRWITSGFLFLNLEVMHQLKGINGTHRAFGHDGEVATEQLDVASGMFASGIVILWDGCHNFTEIICQQRNIVFVIQRIVAAEIKLLLYCSPERWQRKCDNQAYMAYVFIILEGSQMFFKF